MEFSQQNSDLIGYGNIFGQNTFKKNHGEPSMDEIYWFIQGEIRCWSHQHWLSALTFPESCEDEDAGDETTRYGVSTPDE